MHVRPPAIDNCELTAHPDSLKLRLGLQEYSDFVLVHEQLWQSLLRSYGGGPELKRIVVAVGSGSSSELRVELYPLSLKVCMVDMNGHMDENAPLEVIFSRHARVQDLLQSLVDSWGLQESGEDGLRLWYRRGTDAERSDAMSFDGWELLLPASKSLDEFAVPDGASLLLERSKLATYKQSSGNSREKVEWPFFRRLRLDYKNRTFKDPRAARLAIDDLVDAAVEVEAYGYDGAKMQWYPGRVVADEDSRVLVQFYGREKPKTKMPPLLTDGSWLSERQLTPEAKGALGTVFKRYATGGKIDRTSMRGLMSCATNMLVQEDSWQVSDLLTKYGDGQTVELEGFLKYWRMKAINSHHWLEDELSRLFERVGANAGQTEEEKLLAQGREWITRNSARLAQYRTNEYVNNAMREKIFFRDFRRFDSLDTNFSGEWKPCEVQEVNWEEMTVLVQTRSAGSSWNASLRHQREWIPMESSRLAEFETKSLEIAEDTPTPLLARTTSHGGVCPRPGACGLQNLGNTCFMAATLQCLSNCGPLRIFFAGCPAQAPQFHTQLSNSPLSTNGRLAREYGRLLTQMWSNEHESCTPMELKGLIGQKRPEFSGYQQQDAQELLIFLLDGLHEDVNRAPYPRPVMPEVDSSGRPEREVAREAWEGHLRRNDSKIVELFQFQIRSEVECPECGCISVTFDPIMYLSLPVPKPPHSVTVTVVPVEYPKVAMHKIDVLVPKGATFAELEQRLWAQLSRQPAELPSRFVFADIWSDRIYKMFKDVNRITEIQHGDNVYALEVRLPRDLQEGVVPSFVPVLFRRQTKSSYAYSTPQFSYDRCAPPRILCTTGETTNAEVHRQLVAIAADLLALRPAPTAQGAAPSQAQGSALDIVTNVDTYASTRGDVLPNDDAVFVIPSGQQVGVNFLAAEAASALQASLPELQTANNASAAMQRGHGTGTTLRQCLEKNAEREQLAEEDAVFCRKCKEHRRSWKKIQLWSLPPQLIIHLKRFGRDRIDGPLTKITTPVEFPVELDLSDFLAQPQLGAVYELSGVVNHHGGLGGGHYTAHALVTSVNDDGEGARAADAEWFRFDDSRVNKASVNDIDHAAGYILFYRQRRPGG